ncbi:DUF167 domain-containing protein [Paludisphaera borealis]|uniref:UPF0235 protein BSF38_05533 n=1 Tax=Paludisphaera borealis TaxID=1387353 RepID=A0A1U7CYD4_9BACT|nr:DUF167 domain-containing protein [Paludisphaera borealis]APW63945.1 hypothetical protein BSF38_05533 [Paludisphaera borealis]
MIELTQAKNGVIVPVNAQPGARRNAIVGERAGAIRVAVTAAPDKGKANAAILELLAEALECRPSEIGLVSGETARQKRVLLVGLTVDEAARRIARALPASEPSSPAAGSS